MSIVKFYRGDPNAPKPTMGAHLGSNAIITCKGRLLDYCDGKLPNLPELEEKLLNTKPLNSWATTATAGAVSRFFY